MQGFITETDLGQADLAFPGIARFFESLVEKPGTFLELLSLFEHWAEPRSESENPAIPLPIIVGNKVGVCR